MKYKIAKGAKKSFILLKEKGVVVGKNQVRNILRRLK
jgi:hypothetical protein